MCPSDSPTSLQNTHSKGQHLGPDTKSAPTSLTATTIASLWLYFPPPSHFLYLSRQIFTTELLWLEAQLVGLLNLVDFQLGVKPSFMPLQLKHIGRTGIHAWFLPTFVGPTATSSIPSYPTAAQEETSVHGFMWADRSNHRQGSERDSKGRMEKSKSSGKKHPCCSCSFIDIVYLKFSVIILNWMLMLSFFSSTSICRVSNYVVKFMLNGFNSLFPLPVLCTIYQKIADFFIYVISFHWQFCFSLLSRNLGFTLAYLPCHFLLIVFPSVRHPYLWVRSLFHFPSEFCYLIHLNIC